MATNDARADADAPENPADLLPSTSVLSLEEYLAMQKAIGDRTRFEIVYRLVHGGPASPSELDDAMDVDDSTLHYHLTRLVDVGLVEKRKRTGPDSAGFRTSYRASALGEVILEHGVEELLRREWDFRTAYDGGDSGDGEADGTDDARDEDA